MWCAGSRSLLLEVKEGKQHIIVNILYCICLALVIFCFDFQSEGSLSIQDTLQRKGSLNKCPTAFFIPVMIFPHVHCQSVNGYSKMITLGNYDLAKAANTYLNQLIHHIINLCLHQLTFASSFHMPSAFSKAEKEGERNKGNAAADKGFASKLQNAFIFKNTHLNP